MEYASQLATAKPVKGSFSREAAKSKAHVQMDSDILGEVNALSARIENLRQSLLAIPTSILVNESPPLLAKRMDETLKILKVEIKLSEDVVEAKHLQNMRLSQVLISEAHASQSMKSKRVLAKVIKNGLGATDKDFESVMAKLLQELENKTYVPSCLETLNAITVEHLSTILPIKIFLVSEALKLGVSSNAEGAVDAIKSVLSDDTTEDLNVNETLTMGVAVVEMTLLRRLRPGHAFSEKVRELVKEVTGPEAIKDSPNEARMKLGGLTKMQDGKHSWHCAPLFKSLIETPSPRKNILKRVVLNTINERNGENVEAAIYCRAIRLVGDRGKLEGYQLKYNDDEGEQTIRIKPSGALRDTRQKFMARRCVIVRVLMMKKKGGKQLRLAEDGLDSLNGFLVSLNVMLGLTNKKDWRDVERRAEHGCDEVLSAVSDPTQLVRKLISKLFGKCVGGLGEGLHDWTSNLKIGKVSQKLNCQVTTTMGKRSVLEEISRDPEKMRDAFAKCQWLASLTDLAPMLEWGRKDASIAKYRNGVYVEADSILRVTDYHGDKVLAGNNPNRKLRVSKVDNITLRTSGSMVDERKISELNEDQLEEIISKNIER